MRSTVAMTMFLLEMQHECLVVPAYFVTSLIILGG